MVVAAPRGQHPGPGAVRRGRRRPDQRPQDLPQLPPDTRLTTPTAQAQAQEQQLVGAARQAGTSLDRARADAAALSPLSSDGRIGTVSFAYAVDSPSDVEASTQQDLTDVLARARTSGLSVEANGQGTRASRTSAAPRS